jgi:hypothetical protein
MSKVAMLSAIVSACLISTAADAQQIQSKGKAGGWGVFFNEATSGCFIQRETDAEIFMQIGTEAALVAENPEDPVGFLSFWIPGTAPENANPLELVKVEIGPNTYFGSLALGTRQGYYGATVLGRGSELGFDLRNRRSLKVTSTSGASAEIQLNASNVSEALDALVKCQADVG